jgi:hypothetical protein
MKTRRYFETSATTHHETQHYVPKDVTVSLTCLHVSLFLSVSHILCSYFYHTNCLVRVSVGSEGNFSPGSKIDSWLVHCSSPHRCFWHLLICQGVLTSWWRGKWLPLTNWYKLLAETTTVVMTVRWPCRIRTVIGSSKQSLGNTWLVPAGVDDVTLSLCLPHCSERFDSATFHSITAAYLNLLFPENNANGISHWKSWNRRAWN